MKKIRSEITNRSNNNTKLKVASVKTYADNWQRQKILRAREHQFKAFDTINNLVVTKRKGKRITVEDGSKLIEFASCSYFGLDQDRRVLSASSKNSQDCGINFAVARTRLRMQNLDTLENLLSKIFCGASNTLFTSLHLTHQGFLPLLASGEIPSFPIKERGPLFIMDKKAHSSLQINRGLLEQFGKVIIVDFQEHDALKNVFKLAKSHKLTPISISDSVISMGGFAPVKLLIELAEKYDGYTYFDDAHGTSLYGKHGCGYVLNELNNTFHPRLVLTASLSKAFGSNAAVLALPSTEDTEMVKRFATPYLFSNPPANAVINAAVKCAEIHLTDEIYKLQGKLWSNVEYFDSLIEAYTLNKNQKTPIRGVFIGDENLTIKCAMELKKAGFFITAAMYPTVALGESIIRVALSSHHSKKDIKKLCEIINKLLTKRQH